MLPQSTPSSVLLLNCSFQPTKNSWALGCPQSSIHAHSHDIEMGHRYGYTFFKLWSTLILRAAPLSCLKTPPVALFLTPQDPATKMLVPSTAESLENTVSCIDLHPFCLVSALVFWFLNILRITFTFTIHLIPAHLSGLISHKFSPQISTTLKSSCFTSEFVHLSLTVLET